MTDSVLKSAPSLSCLGLIPARAGSKRITNKNIRTLAGHPLLLYSIASAKASKVFKRIIVSTDCPEIAEIARKAGAECPFLRPAEYSADHSPDIDWLRHLLTVLKSDGETADCFSILRPTSPFRQAQTIQRAWQTFLSDPSADSLRAIERCSEHPAKMWQIAGSRMTPVMANPNRNETPWHSRPYQVLPEIYVQNASLEIAWCKTVLEHNSISGHAILPFVTEGYEGFDINHPEDWVVAEHLLNQGTAQLPEVKAL
jgi:N-acylneuraminate cytidylyltransferase